MSSTRANLDIQSDKVLTEPRIQTRIQLKDELATQGLNLDWEEPVGADRTVTFQDPGGDDAVAYLDSPQVFQNKQITTVPVDGDDIANKTYVDGAVAGAAPTATSAPGGGTQGKVTADEDKGLLISSGVMEINIAEGLEFSGSGELKAKIGDGIEFDGSDALTVPVATSAAGGDVLGRATFDENSGLTVTSGVAKVKVDGGTVQFNDLGELQAVGVSNAVVASRSAIIGKAISGVPTPADGSIGTDIDTLDFPSGSLSGVRFDFTVPDDYLAGSLNFYVVYCMNSAVAAPNNQIRISTRAKIVDVTSGAVDAATYPETGADFVVPDNSTDVVRQLFKTISSGDFGAGDRIQCYVKRDGADANDLHGDTWRVVAFQWTYTSGRGGRAVTQSVSFFQDADGETRPDEGVLGGDVTTEDFPPDADSGLKAVFIVPDEWDGNTDAALRLSYAMSGAAAGVVRLDTYGEIVNVDDGTIDAVDSTTFDLTPAADTNPHRTVIIRSIPATALHKGDFINLVIARRVAVTDNHAGSFKLVAATLTFGTATVSTSGVQENYLGLPVFGNISGAGVFADDSYPDFAGDFEILTRMRSTVASGRVDAVWQGRLTSNQTQVSQVRLPIKGSGSYRLCIYVDGLGSTPSYDSGLQAAPGTLTPVTVNAVDLSDQPSGQKRYHVVVEAHVNASEEVYVGHPLVQQE